MGVLLHTSRITSLLDAVNQPLVALTAQGEYDVPGHRRCPPDLDHLRDREDRIDGRRLTIGSDIDPVDRFLR